MANSESAPGAAARELYLVFGGEVVDTQTKDYADPGKLDIRGIFASYDEALAAWRAASQQYVDNAFMKYVIVRLF
ncbi:DUF4170 domain-containing protein [Oceanibacterium hippocampi]|uniref:DUF4170 domain-containing protein n=1 Tax=Oceanibacterium hippocampi TaxID=745714 RepID=A0A1Y5RV71_9PROT|nr:DUF4170 domain-containing protein [Oceanibacterium hippocampi]SLN25897.1 hypothetical protein OCH7691_00786 [Oceanibacterium hippocampi]